MNASALLRAAVELAVRNLWSKESDTVQSLFAHSICAKTRVSPRVPFDPDDLL